MNLEKLKQIFLLEAQELLQQMEEALLLLESTPDNTDAIHRLFRATHTLKGSASLIELKTISEFAHVMENVLDRVRGGKLTVDHHLIDVLLASRDHVHKAVEHFSMNSVLLPAPLQTVQQQLQTQLNCYLSDATSSAQNSESPLPQTIQPVPSASLPQPLAAPVTVLDDPEAADDNWHLSLRFHAEALRNGIDPLAVLRYLLDYGKLVNVNTLFDALPNAANMQPERCYLGFEIEFNTDTDKETIESLFELVRDYCQIRILPPHSLLSKYIQLIEQLPEDSMYLGEILVNIGTLTARELEMGLQYQLKPPSHAEKSDRIGEILVEQGIVPQRVVDAALDKQQQIREKKSHASRVLHIEAEKLDQLINLVGELVIVSASIGLQTGHTDNEKLKESVPHMARLVEDIRNRTLSMRMVQIHDTFDRFPRLVRDLSQQLDKKVNLVISGKETELDKSMVEKIAEPLMHLVRNAIDHGIETQSERTKSNKPIVGTVHLNAYHSSGNIVIEVKDDGRGLDRQKIFATAIKRGLVKPDQNLSEIEIEHLIFEPGFSTCDKITQISGRGVGLDVVKRTIHAQNGNIEIQSQQGQGTTIKIHLPLTLAIIDGFLINVGNGHYVIPLDRVVECVEHPCRPDQREGYIKLRDKLLPLLRLHQLFSIQPAVSGPHENIVVVEHSGCEVGLVVDNFLGEFQAVIKPLSRIFEKLIGISGATILGTGEVALILDIPTLIQHYALLNQKGVRWIK